MTAGGEPAATTARPVIAPARRETLFISVAAYCDPLLAFTLRSAVTQAADPSRLFFGVVEQTMPEQQLRLRDSWAQQHVRWARLHALDARGPCWARSLGMSLYQGEDWYLQIDSHTWFEPGWDQRLLRWARHCAGINPRCLLSCYPNPFRMVAGEPTATVAGALVLAHVVSESSQFANDHPVLYFEGVPVASEHPVPGLHVGAGCLLAPGRVVDELPYDPQLYFHGEEQAFALRAWTHGWDIFHVPGMPMYHQYHAAGEAPRALHWSPELDARRAVRSAVLAEVANRRLAALLWPAAPLLAGLPSPVQIAGGADAAGHAAAAPGLGVYGLGTARSLADYARFSGIDYAARHIEPRARKARFGY